MRARSTARFLDRNLDSFLELGDRGTYLDKDELRRFFELSLPGVDELMAWMRIGELAEENPDATIVVDTAPTGHTLRMLGSGGPLPPVRRGARLDAGEASRDGAAVHAPRRARRDGRVHRSVRSRRDAPARDLLTDPGRGVRPGVRCRSRGWSSRRSG